MDGNSLFRMQQHNTALNNLEALVVLERHEEIDATTSIRNLTHLTSIFIHLVLVFTNERGTLYGRPIYMYDGFPWFRGNLRSSLKSMLEAIFPHRFIRV